MSSPSMQMSATDWVKSGRTLLFAVIGCAIAWVASDILPHIDTNNATGLMITAVLTAALDAARRWFSDTTKG